jgi:hypothetical protein
MKFPIYVAEGSIPSRTRGELENSSEERGGEIKTPTKTAVNTTELIIRFQRKRFPDS